ncbi:hypothetical protein CRV00_11400 [Malaciobacter molluscorum]|uniref:Spy/CpxP family protein refolding chaperone n=1 Tax=Malaciobacter molluscorum TaxID=1032072 RepID=UPI00100A3BC6|nr:Spy/CpxP family protein refolding chaperone [Malaciobacter molluscorum]RXJ93381.1 hypothetical protein CRV00_11400 [Malaciobacter molluscorum]
MKRKILAATLATTILTTGLFAYQNNGKQGCEYMNNKNSMYMNKKGSYYKHHGVMGVVQQLNLSAEQKIKIADIMKSNRGKMQTINDAFTKTEFDKNKFIKILSTKRENMIKLKAQMISDIYDVLTKEQKEQFKVLLDLKTSRFKG